MELLDADDGRGGGGSDGFLPLGAGQRHRKNVGWVSMFLVCLIDTGRGERSFEGGAEAVFFSSLERNNAPGII